MDNERIWTLVAKKLAGEATAEDILELYELLQENPEVHYSLEIFDELWQQNQFAKDKLMEELHERENLFFVAYYGDEIAGYLKLRDGKNPDQLQKVPAIEIVRIYSRTPMIGKGIGRALMQTSIDTAIERNKDVIWLGVWEKNQRAIDFYAKWGFEKFGEHDFILGNDVQTDWLMKKDLRK